MLDYIVLEFNALMEAYCNQWQLGPKRNGAFGFVVDSVFWEVYLGLLELDFKT